MFFNNNKCCCQNNWQQEGCCNQEPCGCGPIVEPTIERCIERNICHQVEHMCPSIPYMKIYGINRYQ